MSERDSGPIRFGVFEADLRTGELRKQGVLVKLRAQPFQVLALLLERPGRIVSRDDLQARLWAADTFVDFDRGLNKAVNRLREALGDTADSPRFIETLPKRGYRFIAPVDVGRIAEAATRVPVFVPAESVAPRRGPGVWWLACAAAIVLVSAGVLYSRRPGRLTERDLVVVADFDNRTGDAAFDHTLKQALALALERSPFVRSCPTRRS